MSIPLTNSNRRPTRSRNGLRIVHLGRHTQITHRGIALRFETTAFNRTHDSLGDVLTRRRSAGGQAVRTFYDVGALIGVLGLVGGLALLLWSAIQISASLASTREGRTTPSLQNSTVTGSSAILHHESGSSSLYSSPSDVMLRPIIPGVTVPLFHLPVIIIALFICQVFHELGHALAAAADAVPMVAAGFSFILALPSAYVALPNVITSSNPESASSTRVKLRIATAGAWHNLLLWQAIFMVGQLQLVSYLWTMGGYGLYKDMSRHGPVVVGIMNESPLKDHIPLGSIITKLDDTRLGRLDGGMDSWDRYLNSAPAYDALQGWCVSRTWYKVQPSSCCRPDTSNHTTVNNGLCFVPPAVSNTDGTGKQVHPNAHLQQGRCVDPIALFMSSKEAIQSGDVALSTSRCESVCMSAGTKHEGGKGEEICIRPRKEVELLRISMVLPPWEKQGKKTTTVIWNGPREEVWEQLSTYALRPSVWWMPIYLPVWVELLIRYMGTITLSLFVFNLLPISKLDGAQVLSLALDLVMAVVAGPKIRDVRFELMEQGEVAENSGHGNVRRKVEGLVSVSSGVLMVVVCSLSLIREMLNVM